MTMVESPLARDIPTIVLDSLPHPVLLLGTNGEILYANGACEGFLKSSLKVICRQTIDYYLPFGSPILSLIDQIRETGASINEYKIDISSPRLGRDRVVDVYGAPSLHFNGETSGAVVLQMLPQSTAGKLDRQLTHKGAARSVTGLASMLAHEIKNPLSGIRGAAQLLEMSATKEDRELTNLIKEETDRIVKLVDRMEVFSDERPLEATPLNIHAVLEHVRKIAKSGFARDIEVNELYDPSLPPVTGNKDQLVQVFLNLVKNAAEACSDVPNAKITLSTGYRPGIHLSVPGARQRIALPIELNIGDNGPGIPEDIREYIFDPFITTKTNGSGLGLALVAKVVGEHGGMIECDSNSEGSNFRIRLPVYRARAEDLVEE